MSCQRTAQSRAEMHVFLTRINWNMLSTAHTKHIAVIIASPAGPQDPRRTRDNFLLWSTSAHQNSRPNQHHCHCVTKPPFYTPAQMQQSEPTSANCPRASCVVRPSRDRLLVCAHRKLKKAPPAEMTCYRSTGALQNGKPQLQRPSFGQFSGNAICETASCTKRAVLVILANFLRTHILRSSFPQSFPTISHAIAEALFRRLCMFCMNNVGSLVRGNVRN